MGDAGTLLADELPVVKVRRQLVKYRFDLILFELAELSFGHRVLAFLKEFSCARQ